MCFSLVIYYKLFKYYLNKSKSLLLMSKVQIYNIKKENEKFVSGTYCTKVYMFFN